MEGREITAQQDEAARLDGCYALKSDAPADRLKMYKWDTVEKYKYDFQ